MQFKRPENTEKYHWTRHSIGKMMQYGLGAQRIIRVIRVPERIVEGVAQNTVAVMQPTSSRTERIVDDSGKVSFVKSWTSEIWVMYQLRSRNIKKKKTISGIAMNKLRNKIDKQAGMNTVFLNRQIKIISAWRYPAMSKEGESLPDEILEEIAEVML